MNWAWAVREAVFKYVHGRDADMALVRKEWARRPLFPLKKGPVMSAIPQPILDASTLVQADQDAVGAAKAADVTAQSAVGTAQAALVSAQLAEQGTATAVTDAGRKLATDLAALIALLQQTYGTPPAPPAPAQHKAGAFLPTPPPVGSVDWAKWIALVIQILTIIGPLLPKQPSAS